MSSELRSSASINQGKLSAVRNLYNRYAAMLLGYIFEVVKNQSIAEQYLIAVFNDVPNEIDEFSKAGVNALCRLQLMARKKLAQFFETIDNDTDRNAWQRMIPEGNNKYIALMTPEQQIVFCSIHYQCKTAAWLAVHLNKPEEQIRIILKECFTIIRNGRDHEKVH